MGYIEDLITDRVQDDSDPCVPSAAKRRKLTQPLLAPSGPPTSFAEQIESLEGSLPESNLRELKAERVLHELRRLMEHSAAPFSWPIPEGIYG